MKVYFKEGDIDEGLIDRIVQLSVKYCSFPKVFTWTEMAEFFLSILWKSTPILNCRKVHH